MHEIYQLAGFDVDSGISVSYVVSMMNVVCAWCKAEMGVKPGPDGKTSHGMCDRCQAKINAELDAMETKK
jgi:hypothetical protein